MRVSASAAMPTTTSTPKGARVRRAATGARVVEPYRAMVAYGVCKAWRGDLNTSRVFLQALFVPMRTPGPADLRQLRL